MFWSTQLHADFRIKVGLKIFNRLKVYFSMVYSSKLRVETVVHNRGCQLSKAPPLYMSFCDYPKQVKGNLSNQAWLGLPTWWSLLYAGSLFLPVCVLISLSGFLPSIDKLSWDPPRFSRDSCDALESSVEFLLERRPAMLVRRGVSLGRPAQGMFLDWKKYLMKIGCLQLIYGVTIEQNLPHLEIHQKSSNIGADYESTSLLL